MTQHPDLYLVDARCSTCGTTHTIRSATPTLAVDVCAACHPAYTGLQRAVSSGGRIERFNSRRALAVA